MDAGFGDDGGDEFAWSDVEGRVIDETVLGGDEGIAAVGELGG